MLIKALAAVPAPAKVATNLLSLAGVGSALVGFLTSVVGLVVVLLSAVWWGLRVYEALARRRYCAHRQSGCPRLCPQSCPRWAVKEGDRGHT